MTNGKGARGRGAGWICGKIGRSGGVFRVGQLGLETGRPALTGRAGQLARLPVLLLQRLTAHRSRALKRPDERPNVGRRRLERAPRVEGAGGGGRGRRGPLGPFERSTAGLTDDGKQRAAVDAAVRAREGG